MKHLTQVGVAVLALAGSTAVAISATAADTAQNVHTADAWHPRIVVSTADAWHPRTVVSTADAWHPSPAGPPEDLWHPIQISAPADAWHPSF
jgi:hypothetical protein